MKFNKLKDVEDSVVLHRLKALFFDWLFICVYLFLLLILTMAVYFLWLNGIPEFTSFQAQVIATFTSVVPIIIIFSAMEGRSSSASWGKRKARLKVIYRGAPVQGSLIRNSLKFLPWQFGHMSTIHGMYHGFETSFSIVFLILSMILPIVYIVMVIVRKDHAHLADILASSRVVKD